jgi:hypothetical protein
MGWWMTDQTGNVDLDIILRGVKEAVTFEEIAHEHEKD